MAEESWIKKMQAENEALRFILAEVLEAIPDLAASRLKKLADFPGGPAYTENDLGYKTCAEEVALRARELVSGTTDKLNEKGLLDRLPSSAELHERRLGPVTYEKRIGCSGEPDYETIYGQVPSRWNEVEVGMIARSVGSDGKPYSLDGVVVAKLRNGVENPQRAAILVQWGTGSPAVEYAVGCQSLDGDKGESRLEFFQPKTKAEKDKSANTCRYFKDYMSLNKAMSGGF